MESNPEWMDRARCREADAEIFYPLAPDFEEARRICRGCAVRHECLRYALDHDEQFGVWGALSPQQRAALKSAPDI